MLRAVTFDFWNTIMWEGPDALVSSRMKALLGAIEEAGAEVEVPAVRAAHQVAFERYQTAWHANEQFCVPDAVRVIVEVLGLPDDLRTHRALCQAFDAGGDAADLHLADGVERCLRALHERGIALSIVCDIGLTPSPVLRRRLDGLGLLELFGSWAFSDEVGWYKPAPEIFRAALKPLGVEPRDALHVGDRVRTDVAGALALGMGAARYRGVFDDPEAGEVEAPIVVDRYDDLLDRLGLT